MLETLKIILSRIRKERIEKLNSFPVREVVALLERKAILSLELPFETTPENILEARAIVYKQKEQKHRRKYQRKFEVDKRKEKLAEEVIEEWIESESSNYQQAKSNFILFLKDRQLLRYYYFDGKPLFAQDLHRDLPLALMLNAIEQSSFAASTQEKFRSLAHSLYTYLVKDLDTSSNTFAEKPLPSLYEVEKFFEYLETRALKSTTIRAYKDVFLARALFYVPLPAKKLFFLDPPDAVGKSLHYQERQFPIPASFIELWKGFACDKLFSQELNERLLHQKIRRLGEYAGLSIILTPSSLRKCMESICKVALNIDSETYKHLYKQIAAESCFTAV